MVRIRCSTFALAASLALSGAAQELTPEDLRARLAAGKPLWEFQWQVDERGELLMSVEEGGEWQPAFGNLRNTLNNLGLFGWLNAFAAGSRDLASLTDVEFHFLTAGLDTTPGALRKQIVTPVEGSAGMARRRALERILAVRLVQERGLEQARPELQVLAADTEADPFLRRAAQDALRSFADDPPAVAPAGVRPVAPVDADVLVYLDHTRMPAAFFLPRLSRELGTYVWAQVFGTTGAGAAPEMLVGVQTIADGSVLVPFEIARRFGNARADRMMLAVNARDRGSDFWLEVQGMFERQRIVDALDRGGTVWRGQDPRRGFGVGPFELWFEIEDERIRTQSNGFDNGAGELELQEQDVGESPIWVRIPKESGLWQRMALPVEIVSATLEVGFDTGITVSLRAEHADGDGARAMQGMLNGLRQTAQRALEDMEPAPEIGKVLEVLRDVSTRVEADALVVTTEIRGMTAEDVSAFLKRLPLR